MKNTVFTRLLSLLLICILSVSLFACKNSSGDNGDGAPSDNGNTPTDGGSTSYTVSVKKYDGTPATDTVVTVMKDGEKVKMNFVDKNGVARFELDGDSYTFKLESSDKKTPLSYDESACVLTKSAPNAEITVYGTAQKTESITFVINDADVSFDTYVAVLGGIRVTVKKDSPCYFIFTPTESGYYKISSSDASASVGYHGAPTFPMINNIANMESDGTFHLNIKDSNIGTNGTGTSQYIISISTESDAELSCVLKIEREGNYVRDISDEPWQDIAPSKTLTKFDPDFSLENLIALDITDPALTVVFNPQDGYYHLGSADGPIVLVRMTTTNNDRFASFTKMCETDRLGAYIYDENGNFVRKESFNDLIAKYAEICDENSGVCPLDKDLEYMIKTVGNFKGWWNYEKGTQIFGDLIVPEKNAWLFACCYAM